MVVNVPDVGSVTFVEPVVVNVRGLFPDVVRGPDNVIVLGPLLTPVPPLMAESVPDTVTFPVVAVEGVRPVEPNVIDVT